MEFLKSLRELCKPDGRNTLFHKWDVRLGMYRPFTMEDIYAIALNHSLNESVPEEVKNTFAIAQNMYAYSWFYYPFNAEAGLVALRATERALKIRMDMKKTRRGLKYLVSEAIRRNLLFEEDYTIPVQCNEVNSTNNDSEDDQKFLNRNLRWPGLSRQKKGLFKVNFCLVLTADTERRA